MTSYPSNVSPSGLKSIINYEKQNSIDEKYSKRRRQKWVAKLKQQQLQQRQLLMFAVIITVLFFFCFLFIWGNATDSVPQRPPPLYGSNFQVDHRKHLRDTSGDELSSSSDYASQRKKRHVIDDDDIGIKSKPINKAMLDEKMEQAIEDLKKFKKKNGKLKDRAGEGFTAPR
jgi:hypothetical protein